jgi:proline dehydrogenase
VALLDRAIVRLLPAVPRPVVQKLSQRYIAGPELKDARATVRRLNAEGKLATVDVLGEEITSEEDAAAIVDAYRDVFADIERCGLDANVSVKLTALGLKLDLDLCRDNLRTVVEDAAARGNFVRIDMEDSSTTDDTLQLYRELRAEGFDNLGVVLQAMLRRTLDDVRSLADLRPSVRLCKGIYVEPGRSRTASSRRFAPTSCARSRRCSTPAATSGSPRTTGGSSTRAAVSSAPMA